MKPKLCLAGKRTFLWRRNLHMWSTASISASELHFSWKPTNFDR